MTVPETPGCARNEEPPSDCFERGADRRETCETSSISDERVSYTQPGRHVGANGIADFALALVGAIDSTVTPAALFQAGHHVIQFGRTAGTVRSSGASFDIAECHVWTVAEGRVSEVAFFIDTAAMLTALNDA